MQRQIQAGRNVGKHVFDSGTAQRAQQNHLVKPMLHQPTGRVLGIGIVLHVG